MLEAYVEIVEDETPEVRRLVLRGVAAALPSFSAGAHIDVHIGDRLIRQYSLLNAPSDRDRYEIAVKREPNSRGGSEAMHWVQAQTRLTIGTPRNAFPLNPAPKSLLLAGGIGVTPLLSMAQELERCGQSFELHYFVRSPELAGFRKLLLNSPIAEGSRLHFGLDATQVETLLRELIKAQPIGAGVYACGPRPFMDCAARLTSERSVLFFQREDFSAPSIAPISGNTRFLVELARSGQIVDVPPDRSIIDVLLAAGIDVCTSCEQGYCGTCLTTVLSGLPDHRDDFLTREEREGNRMIMPCVSRARSDRLVLDL